MLPNMGNGEKEAFNALIREVELSSKFDSERLVKVYGACLKDPSSACIVMELLQGNLHQRIYDRSRPRMSAMEVLQVTLSLIPCSLQI
jgi:Protein tyrosine and serine/threonine kinase